MRFPNQTEILIVGAGPSGLAVGAELARNGVSSLVIDRQAAGANTSRAAVIHARTLEALEPLGVVPELHERGVEVPIFRVRDRDHTLITIDFGDLPSAYPYTLMCPQSETEAVLLKRLEDLGGKVVRPGTVTAMRPDGEGATVVVSDADGEHTVRARYVIGCDGMHSLVREQAGIAFEGASYQEDFVLADVHMDWPLSRKEVNLFFSPAGLAVVAPLPHDRIRVVATVQNASAAPSAAEVQDLLDERGPRLQRARVRDVVWSSRFHVHHRVARSPRRGNVFLVGDAAHVHSPAGGQGMNTGIQDGISLARVLAAVANDGDDSALDGWAERRHRVASEVVALTNRMTRLATIESRAGQAARNAAIQFVGHLPPARRAIALRLSELSARAA
jgi:2-polyprenyl-6-methoxyphenol hydroxylase-like FAD-dependent oxidoreductase